MFGGSLEVFMKFQRGSWEVSNKLVWTKTTQEIVKRICEYIEMKMNGGHKNGGKFKNASFVHKLLFSIKFGFT